MTVAATAGNGIPTGVNDQTIVFSPNVNGAIPTAASQGAIDWACTSATDATATNRGLANRRGRHPARQVRAVRVPVSS